MDEKDFVNFCDFANLKALLCPSPLSWTALSEFFASVNPKFFHKKTIALSQKSMPMKYYPFKSIRVKDVSH